MKNIKLLDCTLRDGAYIVEANFGDNVIKNIISNLQKSNIEIIECGWLKNEIHKPNSTFFHCNKDFKEFTNNKTKEYSLMIDYNRYDTNYLENNEDNIIDFIRITFPIEKIEEGLEVGKKIIDKGYKISFQLTNIKSYFDENKCSDICNEIIKKLNIIKPKCICLADTFGGLYNNEIETITNFFDKELEENITMGLHTHNNLQLAFSNTITFIKTMEKSNRDIIVDASLMGMGRGAGNTPTELLTDYLNKNYNKKYDIVEILKCAENFILPIKEKYFWGYDLYNAISGRQCSHVNNYNYLIQKYNISPHELEILLNKMEEKEKWKYDYNLLDKIYNDIK